LLERSGFRVERMVHLVIEQNPFGMWQTLLNWVTRERDVAFRALKRDLGHVPGLWRDLGLAAFAGPVLIPVAVALELVAGLGGHGGSVVVLGSRESAYGDG